MFQCCGRPNGFIVTDYLESNWLEYDFGELKSGTTKECELLLTNISSKAIIIDSLIPSCNCIEVSNSKRKIRSLETVSIKIKYHSSGHVHGQIEQSIIVLIKDKENPILFTLQANVI